MSPTASVALQVSLLLSTFTYILLYTLILHPKQKRHDLKKKNLPPPGPTPLPIIGNLHMLGTLPHRTLRSLAKKHGPIMSLQLGQVPTVVVSSSEAAELFLKTHDSVFASRPKIQALEIMSYGSRGVASAEYGPYWRSVKKLCTMHLLTASKVDQFGPVRRKELGEVVKALEKGAAAVGEVVDVGEVVENIVENVMYKMILGRNKDDQFGLKRLIRDSTRIAGAFNLADYVPWLGAFDLQGLTRDSKKTSKAIDEVLEKIINEHEEAANADDKERSKDFIDILLSIMRDPKSDQHAVLDRTSIKAIVLDMMVGAIDSTAATLEWGLSELLRHPRVMKNLQHEIENVVGMNRMVEEKDLMKLSYLDMVVNETFRLYTVGTFLVPREAREDITIGEYYIKKKTRVLINAWAIGRDPKVWSDNAETFYPERFINRKIDYRGQEFQLLPFGSGRRICAGIQMGLTNVKLVMAQLVHCFNWELPPNVTPSNLNMQEKFGLTIPRAHKLMAIPTSRLVGDTIAKYE